jgi:hypothetical protein
MNLEVVLYWGTTNVFLIPKVPGLILELNAGYT